MQDEDFMKKLPRKFATSKLERVALAWLNREGRNYDNGVKGALKDLMHGGCASGMVGDLIYYHDTVKFYRRHKTDIHALLRDAIDNIGGGPNEVFGDKWDKEDPLADESMNQNLLAWFGFEEAARNVAARAGMEI
jgi:hypothetical protein